MATALLDSEPSDPAPLDEERLDETFAALANTTRRAILARLAEGEATVNELARPFDLSLPAISRHIKVLERAGLITQGQRAQYRPCSIDPAALHGVAAWAEQYRELWEHSFDRMGEYLDQLQSPEPDGPHPGPQPDHHQPDHHQHETQTETENP